MDRRSLLYVALISLILFGVNWYFETQNQEAVKAWQAQQKAKNELKIKNIEQEIATHTLAKENLPINGQGELKIRSHTLTFDEGGVRDNAIDDSPLVIGEVPDFGKYELQLYAPKSSRVYLAYYDDGQFSIPYETLAELKGFKADKIDEPVIALFKVGAEWLPVGIFNPETRKLSWLNELSHLKTEKLTGAIKRQGNTEARQPEQYYVLENGTQQLVFSNWGGALAEINLPFQTSKNDQSVVKEIGFDREMVEQEPQNARFPAHPYQTADRQHHLQGHLGGYYPLIRRDLIQKAGKKSIKVPPRFYALNLVSEYPEMAELVYEVKEISRNKIVFEANQEVRKITKTFTLADDYILNLDIQIEGDARGLWLTTGIPEVEWISGGPAPVLKYRITRGNQSEVEAIDLPKDVLTVTSTIPDWIANSNGFLGVILDPITQKTDGFRAQFVAGNVVPSRLVEIDEEYNLYPAEKMPGYNALLPLKGSKTSFRIFAGPFATPLLKKVDATYSDPSIGYNPDYLASQTFHGWFAFISEPFAKFLLILMRFFYWITHSWAFSIILLTVALRVMLYPLNAWSLKSTIKMQAVAPEIHAIQERHKKDPKKAQLEIVNLYRERGINPLSGCLPLLIQMPFLIGMFDLLKSTFELRGASFIPGWIDDLAAPDVLFSWKYPIFFIGNEFHLLPFILGGVMFLQQMLMSPTPSDPKLMTDQQRQARTMGTMMTVVFTFLFYHFPSGLNIYWLSSMALGILQQWWTAKTLKPTIIKGK